MIKVLAALCIVVVVAGCNANNVVPQDEVSTSSHMPPMPVPADNPMNPAKVALGHRLFYEGRLSSNGVISCAACHRPEASFTDAPKQVSEGVRQQQGQRNTPTIINAGYRKHLFWDGRAPSLEDQAMTAFMHPEEMDADTHAVGALMRSPAYAQAWREAFGDTLVTMKRVMQAIAAWERTVIASNSRYDRFVRGEFAALTAQEREGMRLFFSDRTSCSSCHGGPDFTTDEFKNTGLFTHYFDRGLYEITYNPFDEGLFKIPTLRNVALTPPYMVGGDSDSGNLTTLLQVVRHYNGGGKAFFSRDKRVRPLGLSDSEQFALVAFLKALTDSSVMTDPRFTRPR
ncbi:MAG: hypothetical protein J5I53_10605 [Bradyrhizobiaceae bacterium]|nr:hypothetical protein [Bradyrhizobiaceae bacterium]